MSGIPPVIWHFPAGELPQEPAARYVASHFQQEWTGSEASMLSVLVAWLSMNEPTPCENFFCMFVMDEILSFFIIVQVQQTLQC